MGKSFWWFIHTGSFNAQYSCFADSKPLCFLGFPLFTWSEYARSSSQATGWLRSGFMSSKVAPWKKSLCFLNTILVALPLRPMLLLNLTCGRSSAGIRLPENSAGQTFWFQSRDATWSSVAILHQLSDYEGRLTMGPQKVMYRNRIFLGYAKQSLEKKPMIGWHFPLKIEVVDK